MTTAKTIATTPHINDDDDDEEADITERKLAFAAANHCDPDTLEPIEPDDDPYIVRDNMTAIEDGPARTATAPKKKSKNRKPSARKAKK